MGHQVDVRVTVTPSNMGGNDSIVSLASVDTEGMSFGEAFAAARAEVGANGVFKWNGGVYGTFYETEWAELSDEFKSEFANHNWASEYANGNVEVALGDEDLINEGVGDFNKDGLINEVDVDLIAENTENFEMSFILDGELSMTEIMDEVSENLPGDILAGNFDVDVEVVEVDPIYEVYGEPVDDNLFAQDNPVADDNLYADDNLFAADNNSVEVPDSDLLDDFAADSDDFIC